MKIPVAFMSYAHRDNKDERLTKLRKRLSDEVSMRRGEDFTIFQDRDDIRWGEDWKARIEESIDDVTFLIPIVSPSFFNSPHCRGELKDFLDREKELGRNDLILPIYYIDTPLLNDEKRRQTDELAQAIHAHQYADWRELRDRPWSYPRLRRTLVQLATQIGEALERTQEERAFEIPAGVPLAEPTRETTDREEWLRRYHEYIESIWADKQLDSSDVEELDNLAKELGLSANDASAIEQKVMGDTKEAILELQERAAREEHRERLVALYTQARRSHANREWQATLDLFEEIHAEDPAYPDPEGLLASARDALEAQERTQRVATLYDRGQRHLNAKHWSQALEFLEEVQRLEPDYRETEALLSQARKELASSATVKVPDLRGQQVSQASSTLESKNLILGAQREVPSDTAPEGQIIEQSPEAGTEVQAGSSTSVTVSSGSQENLLDTESTAPEDEEGDLHADRAFSAHQSRDFEGAIKEYKQALSHGVRRYSLADIYNSLGNAYNEMNRFDDSIAMYNKALEINPDDHRTWVGLGVVYRLMGDLDTAERHYLRAAAIKPDYAELHASLGALYIFRDEPKKAILSLENAIALDPQLSVAHANMALALAMEGKFDAADASLQRAVSLGYWNRQEMRQRIDNLKAERRGGLWHRLWSQLNE